MNSGTTLGPPAAAAAASSASAAPELLLALDRGSSRPLRAQLEDGLRGLVRAGRLPAPELRTALAAHLRRVRGVEADPRAIVVTAGAAQGLALMAQVLGRGARGGGADGAAGGAAVRGGELRIAVEDPSLPRHREILQA